MGKVTYLIDHYMYIPKTVKAQLSPYLPFKEGWRLEGWLEVGEGGDSQGGKEMIFFNLKREGENSGEGGLFYQ